MTEQPQTSSKHQDHALKGVLEITRYGASHAGHDVELEFDRRLVVLNRARLKVDGELVDSAKIFYGEKELKTTAPDGTEIIVAVDSGMSGEVTRAQLRTSDGSWIDLQERPA